MAAQIVAANSPGHPGNSNYSSNNNNYSSNNNNYNSYLEASGIGNQNVPPQITGNIIDPQVQQESNEGYYLDERGADSGNPFVTYQNLLDQQEEDAYNQSLQDQQNMQQSVETAYGLTALNPLEEEKYNQLIRDAIANGQNITSMSGIDQGTSQIQNLTNEQIQQLIDSGFVAAESDGILGGTMGAELVTNKLKEQLANATNQKDYQAALDGLNALNAGIGGAGATQAQFGMGLLNPDQSAVYSFGSDIDVSKYNADGTLSNKSDYLKNAYYNMASKNITPNKYRSYMHNIGAFGHRPTNFNRGYGGGGGGYGGGGGGGGESSRGAPPRGGMPQGNPNDMFGAMSPLQQMMINTNAAKGFNQGYNRGGIVSLVK